MSSPLRLALLLSLLPACAKAPKPTTPPTAAAAPQAEPETPPAEAAEPEKAEPGQAEPEKQPEAETPPPKPPTPWTAQNMPPLTEAQKEIFFSSTEDEEPEVRGGISKGMENLHYTIGNEWTLFAFYKDIKDLGGGYMGVGTDQAYLFIGWQKPELAWLTDYDPKIQRMHHMYKALFLAAKTPKEFTEYFIKDNMDKALAAIASIYDGKDKAKAQATYKRARKLINFRMFKMKRRFKGSKVPTYFNNQAQFDYIKKMYELGRIRPMLVNLLKAEGVKGVNAAASELEVPIRVLYISNAEEYWKTYDEQYRANIASLHSDDKSLLLRTRLIWNINNDYVYIVQPIDNYRAWLADPEVTKVRQMLGGRPKASADKINYFRVKRLPASARNKGVSAP